MPERVNRDEAMTAARAVAWAVAALLAGLLLKIVLMRAQVLGGVLPRQGLMRDAVFVALALAPALLFWRRRGARAALLVLALLLGVSMFGTVVYQRYFDEVASLKVLQMSGQVGELGGSVAELLAPLDLLFFIDLPVLAWLLLRTKRGRLAPTPRGELLRGLGAITLAAALTVTGISSVARMPGMLNGVSVGRGRGVFTYQVGSLFHRDRLSADVEVDPALPASVISTITEIKGAAPAERAHPDVPSGVAAGRNVIFIQCEALQDLVIGATAGGVEVTPNLNALAAQSWYFPNAYSQIGGGNTADAEWVSNTSLYPPTTEPASVRWEDRQVPSLPRVLGEAGYTTATFHTNDASFWNRRNLYAALGFDRYYDRDFFGTEDEIVFGSASDDVLFSRTLDELVKYAERGEPFYAQIITMSAHHPFRELPARKEPVMFPAPFAGTFPGGYLSNQEYADGALGTFIDGLKQTGLWDTSIVVVYGDHFGLRELEPTGADKVALEELLGRGYSILDKLNVPLIIHLPGQTQGAVANGTATTMDLAPTTLDVLGITTDTMPMFGRSLFAGGPVQKYVAVGSYIDESALVIPNDERIAVVVPIADPLSRPAATQAQIDGLEPATQLMLLSGEYCDALPIRPDFVPDDRMNIPTWDDK